MSSMTQYFSQGIAIAADGIHSASQSTSEKLTAAVDLSKWRQVLFVIDTGTLGTSGTLDFQVKASNLVGGTYTAIPSTAITQCVVATDNNKYVEVSVRTEAVNALGLNYAFLKGSLLPGTAASNSAVIVLGEATRFEPASDSDDATVKQIVNY